MKRMIALLLAAMMLLGTGAPASASGEAAGGITVEHVEDPSKSLWPNNNFRLYGKESAAQITDFWLQVEAKGQINVTVPLFVVFKTDIDGGSASTSNAYRLVNNSTAAVKVTQVQVTDLADKNEGAQMVRTGAETGLTTNQYNLKMAVIDRGGKGSFTGIRNVFNDTTEGTNVLFKPGATGSEHIYTIAAEAEQPGLWTIGKPDANGDSDESPVALTLTTGPLNFVTRESGDSGYEQGVKMLSVHYTVQIDDMAHAVGEEISGGVLGWIYAYGPLKVNIGASGADEGAGGDSGTVDGREN